MAWMVRLAPQAEPAAERAGGMLDGLKAVLGERTMRAAVSVVMLLNAVAWPVQLITVVLLQQGGVPPWQIGLVMAGFAVGALAGTLLVAPLHRALRPGVLLVVVMLVQAPTLVGLALPLGVWWTALMCVCFGIWLPQVRVLLDVLVVRQIPDERRGRALSGVLTLLTLSLPVAMVGAGLLMDRLSAPASLLLLAGALVVGAAAAVSRASLRTARWPDGDPTA